jgi:hypothetical protein
LENTLLYANITNLHNVSDTNYEFHFVSVLSEIKTQTHLENGSVSPAALNQLISKSIIPTGVYQQIDDLFSVEPDNPHSCDTYLSFQSGTLLSYGHRQYNVDAGHGWNCVVNTTTGFPVYVEIWESEICPGTDENYRIILTLIDSSPSTIS